MWVFILNGALECGLYLHFVGVFIPKHLPVKGAKLKHLKALTRSWRYEREQ
jgi:hypothetical protein